MEGFPRRGPDSEYRTRAGGEASAGLSGAPEASKTLPRASGTSSGASKILRDLPKRFRSVWNVFWSARNASGSSGKTFGASGTVSGASETLPEPPEGLLEHPEAFRRLPKTFRVEPEGGKSRPGGVNRAPVLPHPPSRPPRGEGTRSAASSRTLTPGDGADYRVPPPWAGGGWGWGEDRRGVVREYRPKTWVTDRTGDMGDTECSSTIATMR